MAMISIDLVAIDYNYFNLQLQFAIILQYVFRAYQNLSILSFFVNKKIGSQKFNTKNNNKILLRHSKLVKTNQ